MGTTLPPVFLVSVGSNEDEVVCFYIDLKVLILMGVGGGGLGGGIWRNWAAGFASVGRYCPRAGVEMKLGLNPPSRILRAQKARTL